MNKTITLNTPITSGDQTISAITLRKPSVSAMRGIATYELLRMDTDTLIRLLPRISEPTLTTAHINQMDCADLIHLGATVSSFLLTRADDLENSAHS
jgi:hypothetical protein